MRNNIILALACVAVALPATAADSNTWHFDQYHSSAAFRIKHMMVTDVVGTVSGVTGQARFDGKNVKDLNVEAQLDPNTINTGDANRDTHLKSADFFDTKKYPTITFKSKKVVQDNGNYKVIGDLTIHGVTREVTLTMDPPSPIVKGPKGDEHVGTTATTTIDRGDYGITYNKTLDQGGVVLGEKVKIELNVDLVRDKETASGQSAEKKS
jgi:polyisoprenoid-binding protein YceI